MKTLSFVAVIAAIAVIAISFLSRNNPADPRLMADEELKDLKDHFKGLDAL